VETYVWSARCRGGWSGAASRHISEEPDTVVTLRPMTEVEYAYLRSYLDEDYAQEVAKAMAVSIEEGRAAAQKQLGELLKDGLQSEG
jgi:uncharacterized protein YgbK (DUF1537 family)